MGKPHPAELRERAVAFVSDGDINRETARHFRVSVRFACPAKRGHPLRAKLSAHGQWFSERVARHCEVTLDELYVELAERCVEDHRATVGRFLHRLELINKSPQGSKQRRLEIAKVCDRWITRRKQFFNKALSRLIFIE